VANVRLAIIYLERFPRGAAAEGQRRFSAELIAKTTRDRRTPSKQSQLHGLMPARQGRYAELYDTQFAP
jgi:hypothetical protein